MKLPLQLTNETDPDTKQPRWIIRDAAGRKLGDFGSRRTAENQMRKHTKIISTTNMAEFGLGTFKML